MGACWVAVAFFLVAFIGILALVMTAAALVTLGYVAWWYATGKDQRAR